MSQARLYVITGPSGSGKSSITRAVLDRTGAHFSVSATTRPRSDQETDGVDYYFIDRDEFEARIRNDEFLEYARVFDNYYGTPIEPVRRQLQAGRPVILEIDVQGGLQVFEKMPDAVGILILPPSLEELRRRLINRRRDPEPVIEKRLQKAQWEIDTARQSGHYTHTIVNDNLEQAIDQVVHIIHSSSLAGE